MKNATTILLRRTNTDQIILEDLFTISRNFTAFSFYSTETKVMQVYMTNEFFMYTFQKEQSCVSMMCYSTNILLLE